MKSFFAAVTAVLAAALTTPALAQEADPADVATPEAIAAALYDVISGPAGEARDWNRFRSLFVPDGARLVPVGRAPDGTVRHRVITPEEYIDGNGPFLPGDQLHPAPARRRPLVDRVGDVGLGALGHRRPRALHRRVTETASRGRPEPRGVLRDLHAHPATRSPPDPLAFISGLPGRDTNQQGGHP